MTPLSPDDFLRKALPLFSEVLEYERPWEHYLLAPAIRVERRFEALPELRACQSLPLQPFRFQITGRSPEGGAPLVCNGIYLAPVYRQGTFRVAAEQRLLAGPQWAFAFWYEPELPNEGMIIAWNWSAQPTRSGMSLFAAPFSLDTGELLQVQREANQAVGEVCVRVLQSLFTEVEH